MLRYINLKPTCDLRIMESVRTAILDLVRAMVKDKDGVSVTERQHDY